ncbi:type VII secretion-associated serine protease [Virgisporangium aurantiacum]|uniref:Type VII secretion-associated serine protease n=2 Tax=Virgisporangium aurantiacum TaxID=175570 RepID=A0A8J3ZKA1_9ACTN|nr:type VII secretion-associated serine protease [Virgisporangium aurantiacum]
MGVILSTAVAVPARADAVRDQQWYLGFLRMAEANRIADGSGTTVAVLDSGVDATQPDLAGAVLAGIDSFTSSQDGRTDPDPKRHGTGIAAMSAGRGHGANGADGIRGIAPKANILPATVWPPGSVGSRPDNIAFAIRWAVDSGADVICIAGGGMSDPAQSDAIDYAIGKGVPIVAAIGNIETRNGHDLSLPVSPGTDDGVFGVGSVGRDGSRSPFSVVTVLLDFVVPGDDVPAPKAGGGYTTVEGTSVSAAILAGIVALVRQKRPNLTPPQLYDLLKATATDKGTPGFDSEYGWGVVDPVKALTAPDPVTSTPPAAPANPPPAIAEPSFWEGDTIVALAVATVIWGGGLALVVFLIVFLRRRIRRRRREAATRAEPAANRRGG